MNATGSGAGRTGEALRAATAPAQPASGAMARASRLIARVPRPVLPGLAAGVLNHPATGVAWLANKIAPYDEQLNPGDLVLGGSFTRPTLATRGDVIHADYGPLGNVTFRFV